MKILLFCIMMLTLDMVLNWWPRRITTATQDAVAKSSIIPISLGLLALSGMILIFFDDSGYSEIKVWATLTISCFIFILNRILFYKSLYYRSLVYRARWHITIMELFIILAMALVWII